LNQPARTARILILVGLLLQGVEVAVWFVEAVSATVPFERSVFVTLGSIGTCWLFLVYFLAYDLTSAGEFERAWTPTLVFAILSIVTLNILSGLLYLFAYLDLGKARSLELTPSAQLVPRPLATGSKVCPACQRANPLSAKYCRGCGFILG
jgi:hypothetical protein